MKKVVFIFLLIVLLSGCSKKEMEQGGPYLAKIGSVKITQADFDREFQALPDYAKKMFKDPEGKERFLDEIIKKEILYQEAVKKGLDKTPEFQKRLEEFKKITLISELFENEITSNSRVSEQEVRDFYDKQQEEFTTSQIRASHILVKTEDEANEILTRLKKGKRFEAVARAVSIDKASAKNGGDLGYFTKDQMVPDFQTAARALKVGELSNPVKTAYGYHIIKVTDKKEGSVLEFDKVKDMILQKLSGDKQKEVFDIYIAELKKNFKIEINKDALPKSSQSQDRTEKPQALPEQPTESKEESKQNTKTE